MDTMDILRALSTEARECELCGSGSWRILHAGDERSLRLDTLRKKVAAHINKEGEVK